MASTRNRNTPGDYNEEHRAFEQAVDYNTYKSYGVPMETMFPGDGFLTGRMSSAVLSNNSSDIESSLFGIGSTNLVQPNPDMVPDIKKLKSASIIDRLPVMIPDPLVIAPNQRPARYLN
jgi:hypothetical protein